MTLLRSTADATAESSGTEHKLTLGTSLVSLNVTSNVSPRFRLLIFQGALILQHSQVIGLLLITP